jgi:Mce-associated membrane protein
MTIVESSESPQVTDEAAPSHTGSSSVAWPRVARSRWLLPLVAAILGGVLFTVNDRHDANADGADDARAAIAAHVEELLTYDYREIDADLARESDWLTGSFADEYSDLVTDKIGPAARKAKVVTEARVAASGVVSTEHDKVDLLLFVDVTTTSSELDEARVSGSRLEITAEYVDGEWRISSLDPV